MSAAAAEIPEGVPVVKSGKKKLILIGVVVLVVLALVGGGATWWLKKRAAHAAQLAEEDGGGKAQVEHKIDMSHPPTFLPLEPFVVNLADRDVDRYAQIGITLELESPAFAEQMKGFMPAVRNAILMVIAHKSARELLDRSGKEDLAAEIMREAGRPMGIEIDPPLPVAEVAVAKVEAAAPVPPIPMLIPPLAAASSASASASTAETTRASAPALAAASAPASAAALVVAIAQPAAHGAKPKVLGDAATGPIRHVHFSSFIIQ